MSQTNPQAGGSLLPRGCTPAVLVFISLAILFIALASLTAAYIVIRPTSSSMEEVGNRFEDWVRGDSAADHADETINDALSEAESAANDAEIDAALDASDMDGVGQEGEEPSDGVTEYVEDQVDQDPVPFPDEVGDQASQSASAPDPKPEGTSTVPEASQYVNEGLGAGAEVYDHYFYGSQVDKPEPYTFVEAGMCGIRTEIYPMPTADLPGTTPSEVVNSAFQAEIAASSDKYTWTPLGEPFELEVNGQPATRLQVMRQEEPDKIAYRQYTVIYGDLKSALVVGRVGNKCYGTVGVENLDILSRVSDTVSLTPQSPVCYVGKAPQEEDYSVACDQWGGTGGSILLQGDHSDVVLGPTTWDECARYMREHNQVGWEES